MVSEEEIVRWLPLARSICRQFVESLGGNRSDRDEAESVAYLAMVTAARRFSADFGVQYQTYAGQWVKKSLARWWTRERSEIRGHRRVDVECTVYAKNDCEFKPDYTYVVDKILLCLGEDERYVFRHYYGLGTDPKSDAAIGRRVRQTKQAVHAKRVRSLERLRKICRYRRRAAGGGVV